MEGNKEDVLQQLWYEVEQEGFHALKKEHVSTILEIGDPEDIAALIINGYTEPVKYDVTPAITYRQADKLADKYSRYPGYYTRLRIAEQIDKKEKEFNEVLYEYQTLSLNAICYLKDYIFARQMSDTLNVLGGNDNKNKKDVRCQMENFNEIKKKSDFTLKLYAGKVIVSNAHMFHTTWKRKCSQIHPAAVKLKTYIKVYKNWLNDTEMVRYSPTSIIKVISNPFEVIDSLDVPEEYQLSSSNNEEKREEGLFPTYNCIPVDNDLEVELTSELNKLLKYGEIDRI